MAHCSVIGCPQNNQTIIFGTEQTETETVSVCFMKPRTFFNFFLFVSVFRTWNWNKQNCFKKKKKKKISCSPFTSEVQHTVCLAGGHVQQVQHNNYLCTYDLYSPVHVLDACISITRASVRGLGSGIRVFIGSCEMASSR